MVHRARDSWTHAPNQYRDVMDGNSSLRNVRGGGHCSSHLLRSRGQALLTLRSHRHLVLRPPRPRTGRPARHKSGQSMAVGSIGGGTLVAMDHSVSHPLTLTDSRYRERVHAPEHGVYECSVRWRVTA